MVEQWTHKPLVLGSNPSLAIFLFKPGNGLVPGLPLRVQANPSLDIFLDKTRKWLGSGFALTGTGKSQPRFLRHFPGMFGVVIPPEFFALLFPLLIVQIVPYPLAGRSKGHPANPFPISFHSPIFRVE